MKPERLHPCDACGGKLGPVFHVFRYSLASVHTGALQERQGLATFFDRGGAGVTADSPLVAVFSTEGDVVRVAAEDSPEVDWLELLLCGGCFIAGDRILEAMERRRAAEEAEARG